MYCLFSDGIGTVVLGEGVKRGYRWVKFDDGCVKSVNLTNRVFQLCDKSHIRDGEKPCQIQRFLPG